MKATLFWIETATGRLAIMPRPRGNDWLEDEVLAWKREGIDVIVSLLTPSEAAELDLLREGELSQANGIQYVAFPIEDRDVPNSTEAFADIVSTLADLQTDGKTIAIHCRQGIGRAALMAIALLAASGIDPETAIQRVSTARGCAVPETVQQRRWIVEFSSAAKVAVR